MLLALLCLGDGWKKSVPVEAQLGLLLWNNGSAGGWEGKTCEGSLETLISNRIPYSHSPWAACSQVWGISKEAPSFTYLWLRILHKQGVGSAFGLGALLFFSLISMTFCHVPFDVKQLLLSCRAAASRFEETKENVLCPQDCIRLIPLFPGRVFRHALMQMICKMLNRFW